MNKAQKSRRLIEFPARRELVTDPVCGMTKPKSEMKEKSVYGGKTYYFCSKGDKKMFEVFPDNWIPKEAKS